jgi:uncharacterized protein HemX
VQPTETVVKKSRPVDVAVGAATSLGRSVSFRGDGASSAPPAAAAPFKDAGNDASTGSYALPLLAIAVLGLALGYAGVRLRRHRRRERLEAPWREQEAAWEGALRRAELAQASGASGPSAQRLRRVGVG